MNAVLFDFDGVLYPETPEAIEMYVHGAVETAFHFGFTGTRDDAFFHARKSTGAHHESSRIFIEDMGLATWPQWLPVFAEKVNYAHLQPDAALKRAITALKINKGILTNAHANWLHKVIRHIDLHDIFEAHKMVSADQVDYQGKARSDAGFRFALNQMGAYAQNTVMIEDLPRNLRLAKKLGMRTMLVKHGRTHDVIPDWVDHVCDTTLEAIAAL